MGESRIASSLDAGHCPVAADYQPVRIDAIMEQQGEDHDHHYETSSTQKTQCVGAAWTRKDQLEDIDEVDDDSSIEYTQYTLVGTVTHVNEQLEVQVQDNKPSNWLQKEAPRSNEGDDQSIDYDAAFESAEETNEAILNYQAADAEQNDMMTVEVNQQRPVWPWQKVSAAVTCETDSPMGEHTGSQASTRPEVSMVPAVSARGQRMPFQFSGSIRKATASPQTGPQEPPEQTVSSETAFSDHPSGNAMEHDSVKEEPNREAMLDDEEVFKADWLARGAQLAQACAEFTTDMGKCREAKTRMLAMHRQKYEEQRERLLMREAGLVAKLAKTKQELSSFRRGV
ncbi:hypothetical protein BCR37DRAFT_392108 [Protomyces lactucae-debilis]|uniref:Uncharacterized protein n=1 Tax=Protomyces lactucae-debilis TaxID=2754530 RepID=A0A1Y2FJ46_PROLT|nr:uncharacterized protein BCR37DRAFT_392108 [Protomyces lactucae-debilis]ORY83627.1 hypothetical protein BCR37DRAFT_392108 [Protomyces lactucae-debilis]